MVLCDSIAENRLRKTRRIARILVASPVFVPFLSPVVAQVGYAEQHGYCGIAGPQAGHDLAHLTEFSALFDRRSLAPTSNVALGKDPERANSKATNECLYGLVRFDINLRHQEDSMAFRPNYNRDRAERDRAARARSAEKLKKKEEKTAQRKALRAAAEAPVPRTESDHKES